jgi:hypothetical protein
MTVPFKTQISTILTPIFGDEAYPILHPGISGDVDSVTNMFAIWTIFGGSTLGTLEGDIGMSKIRLQISIYTTDYTELDDAQKAVSVAMIAANQLASDCVGTAVDSFDVVGALTNHSTEVPAEGQEEDTGRYYSHMTYYCWSRG